MAFPLKTMMARIWNQNNIWLMPGRSKEAKKGGNLGGYHGRPALLSLCFLNLYWGCTLSLCFLCFFAVDFLISSVLAMLAVSALWVSLFLLLSSLPLPLPLSLLYIGRSVVEERSSYHIMTNAITFLVCLISD
jgi:hypothetical protein